jgi:hypothetical protein
MNNLRSITVWILMIAITSAVTFALTMELLARFPSFGARP